MSDSLPTDASTGSTLNGTSWLKDLLTTGLQGYIGLEAVKLQNRTNATVTTEAATRVTAPATTDTVSPKVIVIGVAIAVGALLLALIFRRK